MFWNFEETGGTLYEILGKNSRFRIKFEKIIFLNSEVYIRENFVKFFRKYSQETKKNSEKF